MKKAQSFSALPYAKNILVLLLFYLGTSNLYAQGNWYVSKNTGSNRNEGSQVAPYKNLQKAINMAKKGDKIYVAEGNYYGLLNKGSLELTKAVELYGGYSSDFSERDILKYQSLIMPPAETNGTAANAGMLYINITDQNRGKLVIDGIFFDKAQSNAYHDIDGKPEGLSTGMYLPPPVRNRSGVISKKSPLIGGSFPDGEVIIRNCIFNNGDKHAIQMGVKKANVRILNNVFTSNLYAAAEVWGKSPDRKAASIEFAYNTVLFNWSRTKAMETMGYGFRCMTGININVHHNIIGLSCLSGIDRTRDEAGQEIKIDNNLFFMNKQADLVLPGAGKFLRVNVEMFDDVEALSSTSQNAELSENTAQQLKTVLNKAYLEGFLSASYRETSNYNPNSSVNEVRRMLGLNQVAQMSSSVSMYGNQYPLTDAVKLFGALKDYGAQSPKK